jgi:restriction endonuclease S subunit
MSFFELTLPDLWTSQTLKEIVSTPITDGPHETPNFVEHGVPFLSVNNIANNRLSWRDVRYISSEDDSRFSKKCKPCRGDILFGKAASVGKVAIVETDKDFNIWSPLALIRPKPEISNRYLYYYLQSSQVSRQIEFFTNSSSQGNIGMGDIERIEINMPVSNAEQRAIAQVLSDFDNLIDGLELLIAKKRSIKEGVMQELLRPKEGWVVRKLDDIARLYNGYAFKSADYVEVGDYKIITIANVQEGQMTYTGTSRLDKLPVDIQAHQKLEIGDILVSMTGNVGRVCQVNIENALLNQRVGKIVGYGLSPSFLFSVLNTKNFQNKMIELAQGGAQGNIGKWDILNFEVCAPSDLSEQNKIAQTIGDLDEELSLLEGKHFKYNQIKQGVMNELITGKTRLV